MSTRFQSSHHMRLFYDCSLISPLSLFHCDPWFGCLCWWCPVSPTDNPAAWGPLPVRRCYCAHYVVWYIPDSARVQMFAFNLSSRQIVRKNTCTSNTHPAHGTERVNAISLFELLQGACNMSAEVHSPALAKYQNYRSHNHRMISVLLYTDSRLQSFSPAPLWIELERLR